MPKVYIIIVNWNGWRDTIECLESVFRLDYDSFRVVVCDNASGDDSLDRIAEWASGGVTAACSNLELKHLTSPPCHKPIPFLRIEPEDKVSMGTRNELLFLVQTGANLGFGGANNVGLRLALSAGDIDFAWLLNNDTVVDSNALSALVDRMRQRLDAGMCGSTLLYYDNPMLVQTLGGSVYNRWMARARHIGAGRNSGDRPNCDAIESRMKYVAGASMLVRRPFLEQIGLMSENYFLYFEEIDWATRARGKYSLAYAPRSVVYHKEGRSIGTSVDRAKRSSSSCYYLARSGMLFTKRYFPLACLGVGVTLFEESLLLCSAGNKPAAKGVLRGLRDSLMGT